MGDVYQNIDFERMLADLGQALERNKGGSPDTPAPVYPKPAAPVGIPTARFDDVPPGAAAALPAPSPGAQQMAPMAITGASPGAAPPMSPQDMQTMAELQQLAPQAYGMGYGAAPPPMPHPAHAPPPMIAQQLAGINPNPAAGGPAGVYPQPAPPPDFANLDPNAAGGLAGYAALR